MKCGYIAVVGRPNVGKSTLINALLGEKLLAVSAKPQTTRHRVLGIKNVPGGQLLFLDTPGIHRPHKVLNEVMVKYARAAIEDADLFLFVVEPDQAHEKEDAEIFRLIAARKKPVLICLNKADKIYKPKLLPLIEYFTEQFHPRAVIPISALKGSNLEALEKVILEHLPEGPALYPEDQLTDQTERFFVTEVVREKIMELTKQEVPYSVAVVVEEFKEREGKDYVRVAVIVEKDSQKAILIGHRGTMIKTIGSAARQELEQRFSKPLFLELFVKVEPDWTGNPNRVREFLGDFR